MSFALVIACRFQTHLLFAQRCDNVGILWPIHLAADRIHLCLFNNNSIATTPAYFSDQQQASTCVSSSGRLRRRHQSPFQAARGAVPSHLRQFLYRRTTVTLLRRANDPLTLFLLRGSGVLFRHTSDQFLTVGPRLYAATSTPSRRYRSWGPQQSPAAPKNSPSPCLDPTRFHFKLYPAALYPRFYRLYRGRQSAFAPPHRSPTIPRTVHQHLVGIFTPLLSLTLE